MVSYGCLLRANVQAEDSMATGQAPGGVSGTIPLVVPGC